MARKTKEEAERTKQRLLESALEVMSERPYSSISMTEIAERIGYSKGAIYWHFRNKHDLLIKLVDSVCVKADEEMQKWTGGEQSLDGIRRYYKHILTKVSRDNSFKMFNRLLRHMQEWPEDVGEKIRRMLVGRIDNERRATERMLTNLQSNGKIRSDISARDASIIISAVFHGIFIFQIEDIFYKTDFSEHMDFLFDAIQDKLFGPVA